ncbi:MAG: UDP-N-acetylmuramoyl-tripeptide--D-alanyl-D-alanine ligase [Oscillospiraceae bacterium]|nr:UDP-N-acetylmuramoyl-tripeptide--D-alanyl-D-alanine ligase [Oscillospiraceae bacterium]
MALLHEEMQVQMTAGEIAAYLHAELRGGSAETAVRGFSTDTRTITPGNCFIALTGEKFNGNAYAKQAAEKGAALCVLTEEPQEDPGVPYVIAPDARRVYADLAKPYIHALKQKGLRVIGITGSSGKTTVKDMTAHVLAAKYRTYATSGNHNNHVGVPYTVLHMPADTEAAVIEMGMNHAGEIAFLSDIAEPDTAVITNIGTAHIGNLGSQENIFRAKTEMIGDMAARGESGTLIAPAEDSYLYGNRAALSEKVQVCYSTRSGVQGAELYAEDITETAESTRFTLHYAKDGSKAATELFMTGLHNVTDALLAVHTGLHLGMTLTECAEALRSFVPGAMRSERVQIGNVTVIRDYYNANPEAMTAALTAMQTIAGDAVKIAALGNMNELGEYAADRHRALGGQCRALTDAAFFCGENYRDFAAGYGSAETAFASQEQLIPALLDALKQYGDTPLCILVKGSRGLHMEHVCEAAEQALRGR